MEQHETDSTTLIASGENIDLSENMMEYRNSPRNIVHQRLEKVVDLQLNNKFSLKATSSVVKLMNTLPNSDLHLPESVKAIKQHLNYKINYKFYIKCEQCDELVEHSKKCQECQECQQILYRDSKKSNFLVYFELETQIRNILQKYFDVIIDYLNREDGENVLKDVDSGSLFKKIREKNPSSVKLLSLTMNADGATIHKSSKYSLWPVQLILNFLPPAIRYKPENIIVSTLFYGKDKPNMEDLLYLLAVEMDHLSKEYIVLYKNDDLFTFLPFLHLCSCDLPARTAIQNFIGTNGKFGCPFCHNPGTLIENNASRKAVRYVEHESTNIKRTHNETILFAERMTAHTSNDKRNALCGVKGHSPILMFDEIDLIDSFPIDIMHGVGLGITKHMVEIWMGEKTIPKPPYSEYKIKHKKERSILEKRIVNFRPTTDFKRKPRPISEIAKFKASELFYLLWYYLRYAIVGLLPTRIVKHFEKLSVATYILCKKRASTTEIHNACMLLKEFVSEFEKIYGPGAITMNLHLLHHYEEIILRCGPIWAYNLFPCENNMGVLKNFVTGPTDVLDQIAMKYAISRD